MHRSTVKLAEIWGFWRCGHWADPWAKVKARRLKETV
jgi:hypothetical protein